MIVNKISEVMGKHRIKIEDVVRNTGLARNTVRGLYYGSVKRMDLDTLDKICKYLKTYEPDIKLADLIDWMDDNA